jgi:UDP-glucuronate 4-epimerase
LYLLEFALQQSQLEGKRILVTGGAGFIGSHLIEKLLHLHNHVVVLDNFDDFYDPRVKRRNLSSCMKQENFVLVEGNVLDKRCLDALFRESKFDVVVHLAAMAGVLPSIAQPALYMQINILGTQNLIDKMIKYCPQARLVFGSSSSVYGQRAGESFKESDRVDQPLSPYAASKAAGELLCYTAYHCSNLQTICLRFFTAYGPRQRPDLAIHKFCRLIDSGKPLEMFGDGSSSRDYTFISDIVDGVISACSLKLPGYEIINLGSSDPIKLKDMIAELEKALHKKADIVERSVQVGDMPYTHASIERARKLLGYEPRVDFHSGIARFVEWYQQESAPVS